ncbi:alpha-amylase family glycosyl hydrolase [Allohahella sp. A8]|uniref:alpha-amylase family glycosyl hydrolase n=1 Tax=Allohahella sp. A8 TaxID=3141461 RepID=UPI003A807F7D
MESQTDLEARLEQHLRVLYPQHDTRSIAARCLQSIGLKGDEATPTPHRNLWTQKDIALITYADCVRRADEAPLATLHTFLHKHYQGLVSLVHLLPFFPYSSDDGFSVMDYTEVNPSHGDWEDVERLAGDFKVMGDLVINHCSSRSRWFDNYKKRQHPGVNYFFEADPDANLTAVVRPRTSPLLKEVVDEQGSRYVWCTFSHDQVDLDFSNPDVLCEFLTIIKLYLDRGITWFRLDAVAFLWKVPGTTCINLPQTHEVIRLLRLLIEHRQPEAVIITETNIPNSENLSYLGNANEAHLIYNFSLPPLLINTLLTGDCTYLKSWLLTMPPSQAGTAYFNFIASHDGIGLRPAEGLLSDWEIQSLVGTMREFGGEVSYRTGLDGEQKPYEINISLWNAMAGTSKAGPDEFQFDRFVCAHAIMLALEGVPAFYFHSLIATENDHARVANTGHFRSINRHLWDADQLESRLHDENYHHAKVLIAIGKLIRLRQRQPAFHPNAIQYILHLGPSLFAFWRQSPERKQTIFAVFNISNQPQTIPLSELNLFATQVWRDLVGGKSYEDRMTPIKLAPYQFIWLSNYEGS